MTPLTEPITRLPHFMPNQVLTHTQLNQVVEFLEQQERLTRQRLIGIGVLCGFEVNLVDDEIIFVQISKGVGVSSCGFLFNFTELAEFTKLRDFDPENYPPFEGLSCLELLPDDTSKTDAREISSEDIIDKVVVLFLDLEDKPNGKCLGDNCDEKGSSWIYTTRVLLINISDMEQVIRSLHSFDDATLDEYFNPAYLLPPVFIERFGNMTNDPNDRFVLGDITSINDFETAYLKIIQNGSIRVANGIAEAYRLYRNEVYLLKNVFDLQLELTDPFAGFEGQNTNDNALCLELESLLTETNCQYLYDFVRDLIDTYNELREEFFAYSAECSPDSTLFPRHLMVGPLQSRVIGKFIPDDFSLPTPYRHHFVSSPVLYGQNRRLKRIKQLIQRFYFQWKYLSFDKILKGNMDEEDIRIQPDKACAEPLGKRRIPFYYEPVGEPPLYKYWDFDRIVQNNSFTNRSYFSSQFEFPSGLPQDYQSSLINPVLSDICKYPKLSIEGHVGKTLPEAINRLKQLRVGYNLGFDILALKLDNRLEEIVLADENLIADLQAMYLAERNEFVCCIDELIEWLEDEDNLTILATFISYTIILFSAGLTGGNVNTSLFYLLAFLFRNFLQNYLQALIELQTSLPPDIKEFRFERFYNIFPVVASLSGILKYGINTWGDIEFYLNNNKLTDAKKKTFWQISDFASIYLNFFEMYLDKIEDDCVLSKFYTIHELKRQRLRVFSLFPVFNRQVHGMEHIAGTIHGGTFILVYTDTSEYKKYGGFLYNEKGEPVSNADIYNADNSSIHYGKTKKDGSYSFEARERDRFRFEKEKYVSVEGEPSENGNAKHKMFSTDAYTQNKYRSRIEKMAGAEAIKLRFGNLMKEFTSSDKNFREFEAAIKMDDALANKKFEDFEIMDGEKAGNMMVVADFYLPHPIHNYKSQVRVFDACDRVEQPKLIDFKIVADAFKKRTGKGDMFKSFVGSVL